MTIFTRRLSGPYFTAVDLANFARELDEDERMRMAEGGLNSPQYLRYSVLVAPVVHSLYCNLFYVLRQPRNNFYDIQYTCMPQPVLIICYIRHH